MSNLIDLEFEVHNIATSPFYEYQSVPDTESKGKWMVKMSPLNGSKSDEPARGFSTKKDAQDFVNNTHYPHTMQPYVKPMPTWIDASERLPKQDGLYLALRKGFTFEMGNASDLVPQVSGWNGGRGCFDDDYGNVLITHWMPIPEFSTMQNLHKGGDCE
ncbi:DUF551 domain-containing protein [Psychrobacter immobilis]|uniref:DUF551 domain-containing protein n=1 Tax=Psychrobacter immobilis TaxID=498 RepID=UPI003FD39235